MGEKRILVVDDEEQIQRMYVQAFTKIGYIVKTAQTAEEALEIFENEQFWVLFLDLNLPGINGIELCKTLKKQYPIIIAYAVTGYASLFELSDCRDAGFEDYFIKPVNLSLLREAAAVAFKKLERWKER